MFGLFKKPSKPDFSEIRDLLFGDAAITAWRPKDGKSETDEPWASFAVARAALEIGDSPRAVSALQGVVASNPQESRQYLQACHFLRQLGVQPASDRAKHVLGVVVEVQMPAGLDILAAYADHTARYINHGGKLIVWEASGTDMDERIDTLLNAGQRVANAIGPWEKPRRGPPPKGHVRLNMLTPSGLHFGEGPFEILSGDPMGGPVIAAGTMLMQALIQRAQSTTA
jgi:hypothetical protein